MRPIRCRLRLLSSTSVEVLPTPFMLFIIPSVNVLHRTIGRLVILPESTILHQSGPDCPVNIVEIFTLIVGGEHFWDPGYRYRGISVHSCGWSLETVAWKEIPIQKWVIPGGTNFNRIDYVLIERRHLFDVSAVLQPVLSLDLQDISPTLHSNVLLSVRVSSIRWINSSHWWLSEHVQEGPMEIRNFNSFAWCFGL